MRLISCFRNHHVSKTIPRSSVNVACDRPLFGRCNGHNCSARLRKRHYVIGAMAMVSFASPRPGLGSFRDDFKSLFPSGAWRVTRPNDFVTNLLQI